MLWMIAAVMSAFFAGITAILSKYGVKNTDSDLATAVRTSVVLVFAWLVAIVSGSAGDVVNVDTRSLVFLILSGIATGASWLCYFKALAIGETSKVAAVDKSSVVISVLLAMAVFPTERSMWYLKLLFLAAIAVGTYLMIDIDRSGKSYKSPWFIFAALSAVFAAMTSILAKIGIQNVDSNLATAIRTCVVFVVAWLVVIFRKKPKEQRRLNKRDTAFIVLSGIATGASWLLYYYAIGNGSISVVVPIDKLSILVTVIFSAICFKEKHKKKFNIGLLILCLSTVCMAIFT